MKTNAFAFAALLALTVGVSARDFGALYDDALLQKWQPDFKEDLIWNYQNAILPKLTPEEKAALRNVKIEVPLRGPQRDVFEFYERNNTVFMPALSLRFFGDISLAYAWLNENKYNLETVQQYIGMIHYQEAGRFPGGLYPRPLDALKIPANAREQPGVTDILNKTFTSAMIFLLCHELGHARFQHPGYAGVPLETARANEAQADAFAVEIMRRVGVIPAGAPFWFSSVACRDAQRVDFASEEEWLQHLANTTHPLTAGRIESLALAIEKGAADFARTQSDPARGLTLTRYVAGQMRTVGELLKDEGVHRLFRTQSATTELSMLAPRRGVAFEVQKTGEKFSDAPFSGIFDCKFGSKVNHEEIDLRLVLRRKGDLVNGEYSYGVATGKIHAAADDQTLYFDWEEGGARGKGRFNWKGDGFSGTWGNKDSRDDGGAWKGKRQ